MPRRRRTFTEEGNDAIVQSTQFFGRPAMHDNAILGPRCDPIPENVTPNLSSWGEVAIDWLFGGH